MQPAIILIILLIVGCCCCCSCLPVAYKFLPEEQAKQLGFEKSKMTLDQDEDIPLDEALKIMGERKAAQKAKEDQLALDELANKEICKMTQDNCKSGQFNPDECRCVNCAYNCQGNQEQMPDCTCKCSGSWTGTTCATCPSRIKDGCNSPWQYYTASKCSCDIKKDHPGYHKFEINPDKEYYLKQNGKCAGVNVIDLATLDYELKMMECGSDITKWKFNKHSDGYYYPMPAIEEPKVAIGRKNNRELVLMPEQTAKRELKNNGVEINPGHRWNLATDSGKLIIKTSNNANSLISLTDGKLSTSSTGQTGNKQWDLERA